MADFSITAADVIADSAATIKSGTAGTTITAGKPVYLKLDDSKKVYPASNAAAASTIVAGIALNAASAGQPVFYIERGLLTITASAVARGTVVMLGASGALCPVADVGTGEFPCVVGIGMASNKILVNCGPSRLMADGAVPA
jgi:hypothetical protein